MGPIPCRKSIDPILQSITELVKFNCRFTEIREKIMKNKFHSLETILSPEQALAFQRRIVALQFSKSEQYSLTDLHHSVSISNDEVSRYINDYFTNYDLLKQVINWLQQNETEYQHYVQRLQLTFTYFDIRNINI